MLAGVNCFIRTRFGCNQLFQERALAILFRGRDRYDAEAVAHQITKAIQHDGAEPGEELAFSIVAPKKAPGFNQCILGQLFGDGWISAKSHGLTDQARLMNPANLAKGVEVAGLSTFEQTPSGGSFEVHENRVQAEHGLNITRTRAQVHASRLSSRLCRRLRDRFSSFGARDLEGWAVLLDKNHDLLESHPGVSGFQFEAAVNSSKSKPLEPERPLPAWVANTLEAFLAMQTVFNGGADHGQLS